MDLKSVLHTRIGGGLYVEPVTTSSAHQKWFIWVGEA